MKNLLLFLIASTLTNVSAQTVDSAAIKQVDSLIAVSQVLQTQGEFEKALEVNSLALKITLEKFGRESAIYGDICFTQGRLNNFFKHSKEAEIWYTESKSIREIVLGKDHPDYANCLHYLGILYKDLGQYEKAETLSVETKTIREKIFGKEHPAYANSLYNLAILYRKMGQFEKAESYSIESKVIRERVLGKAHPDYANSLNNLGNIYFNKGIFEKAEPLLLECKAIREKSLGKEHPDYILSLNNLSLLYSKLGQYEKAKSLSLESKFIYEKVLGKEHPDYANCLNVLALIYLNSGNYQDAEALSFESMAIREKVFGKEHLNYAWSLNNIGFIYKEMGQYEKAEQRYLESIAIKRKVLGNDNIEYASSLTNLANLYREMGKYEKAEPLYLESISILEKVLGNAHPDFAWSLNGLADLYQRTGRYNASEILLLQSSALNQSRLKNAASFLSQIELNNYTSLFEVDNYRIGSYFFAFLKDWSGLNSSFLPSLYYDITLFYKGFLLQTAIQTGSLVKTTPESRERFDLLKGYRFRLAAEYTKPIAERKGVSELEEMANTAEKELARSVSGYSDAIRQVKWQDVQTQLKPTDAALEYVSIKINFPRKSDSIMYAALLIKSGNQQPKFIPLFAEKFLDSLLNSRLERKADYVNNLYTLADRGAVAVESLKKSLYEILWKPLEKELTDVNTIYFSPSGLLHRINLDAIPIAIGINETETLADRYKLIKLNSTRQLVIPTQLKNVNNDALLYGGIQFEQDSLFLKNEPLLALRSGGELSFDNVDSSLRGGSWNYLIGTEREVNAIEKIMKTTGMQVKLKKGYEATEESFKNIGANNSPSPRILHIATHGYFFADPKSNSQESVVRSQTEPVFKMSDHPMLRSGLIMAGGNAAWQGKQTLEGREDGILTAYEISQMNLSNTELVVLSACETGLGDIQGNEGVYGLQRAFKIAGAKYLIMSLWQVPDKQTSLLMTTFYKKWLEAEGPDNGGNKMKIPDAFHAAQKELREIGLDPYQWAGFVLVE